MREAPTNWEIAVVALDNVGGSSRRMHTEDVARECHRLAPVQFSWRKYADLPDCDIARVALSDARKSKHGSLVTMTGPSEREGLWMLTAKGVHWLHDRGQQIRAHLTGSVASDYSRKEVRQYARRALVGLMRHRAFVQYQADRHCGNVGEADFVDSLNCTLNSPAERLRGRIEEIRTSAAELAQHGVLSYLEDCEQRFSMLLQTSPPSSSSAAQRRIGRRKDQENAS